ncbi:hypothetical protein MTP99_004701 [Tenebrio molitor]|nr:hypothetical protein MTP99_004701 [Tenebrio molitor]
MMLCLNLNVVLLAVWVGRGGAPARGRGTSFRCLTHLTTSDIPLNIISARPRRGTSDAGPSSPCVRSWYDSGSGVASELSLNDPPLSTSGSYDDDAVFLPRPAMLGSTVMRSGPGPGTPKSQVPGSISGA